MKANLIDMTLEVMCLALAKKGEFKLRVRTQGKQTLNQDFFAFREKAAMFILI